LAIAFVGGFGDQAGGPVAQAHGAGRLVGMLAARATTRHPLDVAGGRQRLLIRQPVTQGCAGAPGPVVCPCLIVAHLPDGICRIRITTEPMFSRSEFVPLVLESMMEGENRLVLDLGLVTALHSPSLANLVTIHIALAKRGGEMVLAGVHERNRKILAITKLDKSFILDPP
jgi:anti-anti-sigma factor